MWAFRAAVVGLVKVKNSFPDFDGASLPTGDAKRQKFPKMAFGAIFEKNSEEGSRLHPEKFSLQNFRETSVMP